jgi:hypothetical protein
MQAYLIDETSRNPQYSRVLVTATLLAGEWFQVDIPGVGRQVVHSYYLRDVETDGRVRAR